MLYACLGPSGGEHQPGRHPLDAPKARVVFQKRVTEATTDGWLDQDWDQTPTGVLFTSGAVAFGAFRELRDTGCDWQYYKQLGVAWSLSI